MEVIMQAHIQVYKNQDVSILAKAIICKLTSRQQTAKAKLDFLHACLQETGTLITGEYIKANNAYRFKGTLYNPKHGFKINWTSRNVVLKITFSDPLKCFFVTDGGHIYGLSDGFVVFNSKGGVDG